MQFHKIAPLTFTSSPEEAISNLKKIIESLPRTKIITENQIIYMQNLKVLYWDL
jgi:uncharacterized protein (DUF1499 family)